MLLLLHAANTLPRNALGVGLSVVHVHHGLRGEEADGDLAFVESLCTRLTVPLHIHRADVPGRIDQARKKGRPESIEEAARAVRYAFFEQLIAEGHADSVLTAHTLDVRVHGTENRDQGSAGGRILRPLLGVRRTELEDYLRERSQQWRTDSSNTDQAFTRNRLRLSILPLLRSENPAIDQTLANLAELAREDEERWQSELSRILPQLLLPGRPVRGGGRGVSTAPGQPNSVALEIDRLRSLDPALRRRVVRAAARQLGVRLSFDETARLLSLAGVLPNSNKEATSIIARAGSDLHLSNQLRARRTLRELHLFRVPSLKNTTSIDPL